VILELCAELYTVLYAVGAYLVDKKLSTDRCHRQPCNLVKFKSRRFGVMRKKVTFKVRSKSVFVNEYLVCEAIFFAQLYSWTISCISRLNFILLFVHA